MRGAPVKITLLYYVLLYSHTPMHTPFMHTPLQAGAGRPKRLVRGAPVNYAGLDDEVEMEEDEGEYNILSSQFRCSHPPHVHTLHIPSTSPFTPPLRRPRRRRLYFTHTHAHTIHTHFHTLVRTHIHPRLIKTQTAPSTSMRTWKTSSRRTRTGLWARSSSSRTGARRKSARCAPLSHRTLHSHYGHPLQVVRYDGRAKKYSCIVV